MRAHATRTRFLLCGTGVALACVLVVAPTEASEVRGAVSHVRYNCAPFGDPFCGGGQVLGDPALALVIDIVPSPTLASVATASHSWVDPRIGTANSTEGAATASLGILRTASYASVSSSPPLLGSGSPNLMRLGTVSFASFTDTLTINSPGLTGLPGFFTASLDVSGTINPSEVNGNGSTAPMATGSWAMQVNVGSHQFGNVNSPVTSFYGAAGVDAAGNLASVGLGPQGTVTFTAPIVFGTPFDLTASFQSIAMAFIDGAVVRPLTQGLQIASVDTVYTNTVSWNGISAVRSGGALVSIFDVASTSGLNYALAVEPPPVPAVPEPATVLLLGAGLVGFVAARRRNDRR